MARYTCTFAISCSQEQITEWLPQILQVCDLSIVYSGEDYILAKERPGQVTFTELVSVEVLVENQSLESAGINLNMIIRNEELPLKANNHCRDMSEKISDAVRSHHEIRTLSYVTG
ncbi:MAG: hypothetical protein AAGF75_01620 [Cyanobacteria bacterium P01_H01_bin.130]